MLTVKQLVETLQTLDQNAEVRVMIVNDETNECYKPQIEDILLGSPEDSVTLTPDNLWSENGDWLGAPVVLISAFAPYKTDNVPNP